MTESSNRSSTSKDKAKSQSRTVGNPKGQRAITKPQKSNTNLYTWGLITLVVVIVAGLVVWKITSKPAKVKDLGAAPASIVDPVTSIPASVFDQVGATGYDTQFPANPYLATKGQPLIKFADTSGARKPGILYNGAEYCPYCAAERWALIAGLSRFGTFKGLGLTTSGAQDVYAGTNTFTFTNATYTSPYVTFQSIENYTNQENSSGTGYVPLQTPTTAQAALITKYDNPPFVPSQAAGGFPFILYAGQVIAPGSTFNPQVLGGLTWKEISSQLNDSSVPATQDIVASANYVSAAVCHIDGDKPADVCMSSGVKAAKKAIGIS